MRYARTTAACLAAAAAALALTGCGSSGYKKTGVTATLPDLTGMRLTDARTAADAAGFTHLSSSDAKGERRSSSAGTWTVCSQKPGTGSADTGVPVKLSVVQIGEVCPVRSTGHGSSTSSSTRRPTHRPTHRSTTYGDDDSSSSHHHSSSHSHIGSHSHHH